MQLENWSPPLQRSWRRWLLYVNNILSIFFISTITFPCGGTRVQNADVDNKNDESFLKWVAQSEQQIHHHDNGYEMRQNNPPSCCELERERGIVKHRTVYGDRLWTRGFGLKKKQAALSYYVHGECRASKNTSFQSDMTGDWERDLKKLSARKVLFKQGHRIPGKKFGWDIRCPSMKSRLSYWKKPSLDSWNEPTIPEADTD